MDGIQTWSSWRKIEKRSKAGSFESQWKARGKAKERKSKRPLIERRRSANENIMKKKSEKRERRDELRREYYLSELKGGVRGKTIAH